MTVQVSSIALTTKRSIWKIRFWFLQNSHVYMFKKGSVCTNLHDRADTGKLVEYMSWQAENPGSITTNDIYRQEVAYGVYRALGRWRKEDGKFKVTLARKEMDRGEQGGRQRKTDRQFVHSFNSECNWAYRLAPLWFCAHSYRHSTHSPPTKVTALNMYLHTLIHWSVK